MALIILPKQPSIKPPMGTTLNRNHPITNGLISLWAALELGGTILYDSVGTNHALAFGSLLTTAPPISVHGTSRLFDGSSGANASNVVRGGQIPMTYVGLVKWNGTTGSYMQILRHELSTAQFLLINSAGKSTFCVHNSATEYDNSSIAAIANDWAWVVGTYDGANVKCYQNGVLGVNVSDASAITTSATATLGLGLQPTSGQPFKGNIAMWAMYNRALTQTEISQWYGNPYSLAALRAFFSQPQDRYWVTGASAAPLTNIGARTFFRGMSSRLEG